MDIEEKLIELIGTYNSLGYFPTTEELIRDLILLGYVKEDDE